LHEENIVSTIDIAPALAVISRENTHDGSLIPILQKLQAAYGYLPREVLTLLAGRTDIPIAKILGAATFYAQFRFEPLGKHLIKVCHGTACHIGGSPKLTDYLENHLGVREGGTTKDGLFTIERVACLGCCSLAPVMMVDETAYGRLTQSKIAKVIKEYREKE
jgi:NADH-quinone oxidoreductase subunit E